MKTANKTLLAAGAVLAAGLTYWALQPRPVLVQTARIDLGTFEQTVSDDGKTRVRDRYVISAPLAGRIERIALKPGDAVAAKQVVAILTPTAPAFLDARAERELGERLGSAEALQLRAKAEVARADAQLAQVRADRDRSAKLAAQGFVAPTAREQADLAVRTAEKSLEAAQFAEHSASHDTDQARAALTRYRAEGTGKVARGAKWEVASPVGGSVLRVMQESEGAVALGTPLVEVADARSLEAVVDVLSQDAVAIRPGFAARLEFGPGLPPLAARVRRVEPAACTKVSALGVEEQRVNVVLDITDDLARLQTIGDSFRVEAHIVVFRAEGVLKVPVGALFRDAGGWAAYLVENGRAAKRAVEVLRRNGVDAVAGGGVKAGDTLIVYPPDSLSDGRRIEVKP